MQLSHTCNIYNFLLNVYIMIVFFSMRMYNFIHILYCILLQRLSRVINCNI